MSATESENEDDQIPVDKEIIDKYLNNSNSSQSGSESETDSKSESEKEIKKAEVQKKDSAYIYFVSEKKEAIKTLESILQKLFIEKDNTQSFILIDNIIHQISHLNETEIYNILQTLLQNLIKKFSSNILLPNQNTEVFILTVWKEYAQHMRHIDELFSAINHFYREKYNGKGKIIPFTTCLQTKIFCDFLNKMKNPKKGKTFLVKTELISQVIRFLEFIGKNVNYANFVYGEKIKFNPHIRILNILKDRYNDICIFIHKKIIEIRENKYSEENTQQLFAASRNLLDVAYYYQKDSDSERDVLMIAYSKYLETRLLCQFSPIIETEENLFSVLDKYPPNFQRDKITVMIRDIKNSKLIRDKFNETFTKKDDTDKVMELFSSVIYPIIFHSSSWPRVENYDDSTNYIFDQQIMKYIELFKEHYRAPYLVKENNEKKTKTSKNSDSEEETKKSKLSKNNDSDEEEIESEEETKKFAKKPAKKPAKKLSKIKKEEEIDTDDDVMIVDKKMAKKGKKYSPEDEESENTESYMTKKKEELNSLKSKNKKYPDTDEDSEEENYESESIKLGKKGKSYSDESEYTDDGKQMKKGKGKMKAIDYDSNDTKPKKKEKVVESDYGEDDYSDDVKPNKKNKMEESDYDEDDYSDVKPKKKAESDYDEDDCSDVKPKKMPQKIIKKKVPAKNPMKMGKGKAKAKDTDEDDDIQKAIELSKETAKEEEKLREKKPTLRSEKNSTKKSVAKKHKGPEYDYFLNINWESGYATVGMKGKDREYNFFVSTMQMLILMMFNQKELWTIQELQKATKLKLQNITNIVNSLFKDRVLLCHKQNKTYTWNRNYTNTETIVNLVSKKPENQKNSLTNKKNDLNEKSNSAPVIFTQAEIKNIVRAKIVSFMKREKKSNLEKIKKMIEDVPNIGKIKNSTINDILKELVKDTYLDHDKKDESIYKYITN